MRFDLYREEVRAVEPSPHVYAAVRAALDASETEEASLERRAPARRYRALAAACLALLIVAASSSWIPASIVPKEESSAYASPLRLASPFIPFDENCAILVDADRGVASAALRVDLGCLGSEGAYDVGVRGAGLSFLPEGAHLGDPTCSILRFSTGDRALAYLVIEVSFTTDEDETLDEPLRERILAKALGALEGGEITLAAEGHASAVYRIQGVEAPSSSSSRNSRSRIALILVNSPSSETAAYSSGVAAGVSTSCFSYGNMYYNDGQSGSYYSLYQSGTFNLSEANPLRHDNSLRRCPRPFSRPHALRASQTRQNRRFDDVFRALFGRFFAAGSDAMRTTWGFAPAVALPRR